MFYGPSFTDLYRRVVTYVDKILQGAKTTVEKVALLEQAKTHLSKFVPQSVPHLIDTNPDALALDKHETDVSVLFLDITGYTKMSEALDQDKVRYLVERYFSSFLDDIYVNHGDINETVGDDLMILSQDKVTLPLVRPGLLTGGLFWFIISFDNVPISIFLLSVRQTTLPVKIFTAVEHGVDPTVAAVSTMLIMIAVLVLVLAEKWVGLHRFV